MTPSIVSQALMLMTLHAPLALAQSPEAPAAVPTAPDPYIDADYFPSLIAPRRPVEAKEPNRYYGLPWFVAIPGVGTLWGGVLGVANIADSGTSVAGFSFENRKFRIRGVGFDDLYLLGDKVSFLSFTVSGGFADVRLRELDVYEIGRDSSPEPLKVLGVRAGEFVQLQASFFAKRLKLSREDYRSKGYAQVTEIEEGGEESTTYGFNHKLEVDLTDDRMDSRVGARAIVTRAHVAPQGSYMGQNEAKDDFHVDKQELSLFFPVHAHGDYTHVLGLNFVHAAATNHNHELPLNRRGGESLGGPVMMRGYPVGRFTDASLFYAGAEYRLTMKHHDDGKGILLSNDRMEGFQLVPFYEVGQVADRDDKTLYEGLKRSYGLGFRAVLTSIVLRLDVGYSDEGSSVTFLPAQPF